MKEFKRFTKTGHFVELIVFPDGSSTVYTGHDEIGVIIWKKGKSSPMNPDIQNPTKFFELLWTWFTDGTERHVIPLIYSGYGPLDEDEREDMLRAEVVVN